MRKLSFIILFLLSLCAGCRHVQYVAVPSVRTEYRDSLVHDSVDRWHTHYEFLRGDTLHLVDTFYRDRLLTIRVTDSLHDTVPVLDTAALHALRADLLRQQSLAHSRLLWLVGLIILLAFLLFHRLSQALNRWLSTP